jgi:hypothetical protein
MKKALFGIVAAAGLATVANADIVQTWRAVVVSNDPTGNAADPGIGYASGSDTLSVGPGQSVLFILSVNLTDTTIPAGAGAPTGSLLRGIGAATSQLVGTSNANGSWNPVNGSGAGVYNSNGTQGIAIPGSGTVSDANSIKGLGILSNGFISGSGANGSGVTNAEGVDVLGILWQPNNYSSRTAVFVGSPFGSTGDNAIWYRSGSSNANGNSYPINASGTSTITVNIVPAPASLALLGLGGLVAGRRRR